MAPRRQVSGQDEAAAVEDLAETGGRVGDVARFVALGFHVTAVVVEMFDQRPGTVFLEGVADAGLGQFAPSHLLGQQLLGGHLVACQRNGLVAAGQAAVPLGRLLRHLLGTGRAGLDLAALDEAVPAVPSGQTLPAVSSQALQSQCWTTDTLKTEGMKNAP